MIPIHRAAASLAAMALLMSCGGDDGGGAGGGDRAGGPVEDVLAVAAAYVGENPPRIVGHDPATGEELWELEGGVAAMFGFGQIAVLPDPGTLDALAGIDLASGDRVWLFELDDRLQWLAAAGDSLIVGTAESVVAIDAATGEQRWSTGLREVSGVLVAGAWLLLDADDGLVLLDPESGEESWQRDVGGTRLGLALTWQLDVSIVAAFGPSVPAAVVDGDRVIVVLDDGGVVALDVGDGAELWRLDAIDAWAVARHSDSVVITTEERLMSIDPATGATRWEWPYADHLSDGEVFDTVQYGDVVLVVGGGAGGLAAVGMSDGELTWQRDGVHRYLSPGASVITVAIDDGLAALDPDTGDLEWSDDSGGAGLRPMTVRDAADGLIVVYGSGNAAQAVEARSGDIRWTRSVDTWFDG